MKRTSPRSSPGCPSNAGGILFIRWSPRRQIQERGWFLPPWASVREPSQHRSLLDHSARKTTFLRRQRTYPAKTSALPHSRMMPIAPARLLGPASRLAASRRNSTISSAGINRDSHGHDDQIIQIPEYAVLAAIWNAGSASAPDIHASVGEPRGLAYTTVAKVLDRLHGDAALETAGSPPHAGDIG